MNDGIFQIAIDGPSGAGKSTIAKLIAKTLGILYLDTGAMYRAVGLHMLNKGISLEDEASVNAELGNVRLEIKYNDGVQHIFLNGKDVSEDIRAHAISKAASDVSKLPKVRQFLVAQQRAIAEKASCVLDGRDICTHVLPNAKFKFYLTASPEARAKRRYDELVAKGQQVDFDVLLQDINQRDYNDMNRAFAPLRKADDAILIDSTNMTIEEVVQFILGVVN